MTIYEEGYERCKSDLRKLYKSKISKAINAILEYIEELKGTEDESEIGFYYAKIAGLQFALGIITEDELKDFFRQNKGE